MLRPLLVAAILLGPGFLTAAQHSGSVRAADQFIPGATVTARQGGAKVVVYTDANGRYALDLTPGVWEIQIEMFGFQTQRAEVTVGADASNRDWTLEMPRLGSAARAGGGGGQAHTHGSSRAKPHTRAEERSGASSTQFPHGRAAGGVRGAAA